MVGRASFAIVDTMGAVNSAARAAPFFRTAEECASSFRKRDARSLEVVASGASASHGTTSSFIVLDPSLTHFADCPTELFTCDAPDLSTPIQSSQHPRPPPLRR